MQTRSLYQASYRNDLEDDDTPKEPTNSDENTSTTSEENLSAEEKTWRKRYGDLRTHNNQLTERISNLERQLQAAQKQEIKIPSSKEELTDFAQKYPDVYRHIRSIAMSELLSEREHIEAETNRVKEDLSKTRRELGLAKIKKAHPDFDELNLDPKFHEWASAQPETIQDWLYNADDPELCVKAIDYFKMENKKPRGRPAKGAEESVPTRGSVETTEGGKKIWKDSEVRKMHPKVFEQFEAEIDTARREGRYDMSA